jgi:hypothetical protein
MQTQIKIRSIAKAIQTEEHSIDNSICIYCGANLPRDIEFQEYHILKVHGLVV